MVAKGSNLLLHLPEEVSPDQCKVQRIMTNGSLLLTLRKVKTSASLQRSEYGSSGGLQSGDRAAVEVSSTLGKTNTVRNKENQQAGNLTGSIKRGTDGGFLKEASARRSDSLEAAYQTRKAREKKEEEERKRREEQDKAEADRMKREERLADARLKGYDGGNMCDAEESDEELDFAALGFDPDEVPPLM